MLKEKWLNYWIFLRVTVILVFDISEKLTEMYIFVIIQLSNTIRLGDSQMKTKAIRLYGANDIRLECFEQIYLPKNYNTIFLIKQDVFFKLRHNKTNYTSSG